MLCFVHLKIYIMLLYIYLVNFFIRFICDSYSSESCPAPDILTSAEEALTSTKIYMLRGCSYCDLFTSGKNEQLLVMYVIKRFHGNHGVI